MQLRFLITLFMLLAGPAFASDKNSWDDDDEETSTSSTYAPSVFGDESDKPKERDSLFQEKQDDKIKFQKSRFKPIEPYRPFEKPHSQPMGEIVRHQLDVVH